MAHGKKEHPMHQAMREKAVRKIEKHSTAEGRVRAFLENEVEDFETIFAGAADPSVTKEQIMSEMRAAIDDRKGDLDEIVGFLAHGKLQK